MPDNADREDISSITSSRRGKRRKRGKNKPPRQIAPTLGSGGRYAPLNDEQSERLSEMALQILDTVGMSGAPDNVIERVCRSGGKLLANNRLSFPPELVQLALDNLRRDITLHGQKSGHELELREKRVYVGSGGAAPLVVDIRSGTYRASTLQDLYDAARLVDKLDNVHFFSRSLVARDMPDALSLDVNTAYASLAGTQKHVMTSVSNGANVDPIADMCFDIAGSREAFVERPFLSININHAVSPLSFSADACDVLTEAALKGIPVHINTFAQLGASSPVTIAGCVAQTMAETLAGMVYAWLVNPNVTAIFGPRPMVTDLRTGSMAGGAGEQALLTAAAIQMSQFYGLSNSTIAGATDSKIADAQSGYEKCLSVSLAAQTGANLITQACGMQAGLMACSFESYVVDNEMLGTILRTLTPIEISESTLSTAMVAEVVEGDGHYLGHTETLKRMQTDFLYPAIADRRDHEAWSADGSPEIRTVANRRAQEILNTHYPSHINEAIDNRIRKSFDIRLPREQMHA